MTQAAIAKQYADAWGKTTEPEILKALEDCWTPLSTYTDPARFRAERRTVRAKNNQTARLAR